MKTKTVEVTARELKVFRILKRSKKEMHLSDIARKAFPGVRPLLRANSWVRNQLRGLRSLKLIKQTGPGHYQAIV